jgi:hypothetical protein
MEDGMKTVTRKIRIWIDAYPMRSVEEEPLVSAIQARPGVWAPDPLENGVRSIVEVELQVPVLIEEVELPPAKAIVVE